MQFAVVANTGATAIASLVVILSLCAAIDNLAAASRMMWAFARDRKYLRSVHPPYPNALPPI